MECIVDIKKEGKFTIAILPFNPRTEFDTPKGTIYVKCIVGNVEFKSKLVSKGDGCYFIMFNKHLLKNLGISDEGRLNVNLSIEPDIVAAIPESENYEMLENEVLKAISERASIRRFDSKEISDVQMNTILNAGLCAPSASNKRPFHFIVSKDREKMISIIGNNPYVKMLNSAAACIVVCGDTVVQGTAEWVLADCSAATQNILLAIHTVGLKGVWCGVRQSSDFYKDIVKTFNLPNYIRPVSLIAFGYSDDNKIQPNRFEKDKIHYESW